MAPIVALDDHDRLVGRGDVVAPAGLVGERFRLEDLRELGHGALLHEPSAHRPSIAGRTACPALCRVGHRWTRPDTRAVTPTPSPEGPQSRADAEALLQRANERPRG